MDMRQKGVAKWGAACSPCAAAKAKCLRSSDAPNAKCDRCERLCKDCIGQVHRPRKKRATRPSRTAHLEERLNGLVDLLRASGELPNLPPPEELSPDVVASTASLCRCIPSEQDPAVSQQNVPSPNSRSVSQGGDTPDSDAEDIPDWYNSYAPESCICRPTPGVEPDPPGSDEALLLKYQKEMTPHFPFIIVPPGTTPAQVEAARPFLWSCIKMVASLTSPRSMKYQKFRIMQYISDHMLMRSERSMDLLQGIIVVLAWYHYHCFMHAQMNNLIQLAISLVADMGINRHPVLQERTKLMALNPQDPPPRSNDDRRALLAVWYLSSMVSIGFQKLESMAYTKYIQQCLQDLEEAKEYESDVLLVHLIRIQHLTEKITRIHARDDVEEIPGIPRAPATAYQSAFQGELDRIKNSLTKNLKNNKILINHINTAILYLYEPPIIDAALIAKFSRALTSLSPDAPSTLDVFYRSNAALRNWFEHWLTIPVAQYFCLPLTATCQLIVGITMLSRWARLVGPLKPNPAPPRTGAFPAPSAESLGAPQPAPPPPPPQGSSRSSILSPGTSGVGGGGGGGGGSSSVRASSTGASPGSVTAAPTATPSPSPLRCNLLPHADPGIPAAMATLKEQLLTQPGLSLDIVEIMAATGLRFEQANREIKKISGAAWEVNIWELAAKKVMITRAKLERWADVIAASGSGDELGSGRGKEGDISDTIMGGGDANDDDDDEDDDDQNEDDNNGPLAGGAGTGAHFGGGAATAQMQNPPHHHQNHAHHQHPLVASGLNPFLGGGGGGSGGMIPGGLSANQVIMDGSDMNCVPGSTEGWQPGLWSSAHNLFDGSGGAGLWFDGIGTSAPGTGGGGGGAVGNAGGDWNAAVMGAFQGMSGM